MLTGFDALSAASAVLQVISFAADVIGLCKKVYDGRPTDDDDLEEYAERLSGAAWRVQSRCKNQFQTQSKSDDKLRDIAKDCQNAAKELETEVRYVTGMHEKGNLLKAINATLRASSHRKKIERLDKVLSKQKALMETEMMSDLCSRGDAIELQQNEEFTKLAADVQSLVLQIAQGYTRVEDLVKAEHIVTRNVVVRETAKAQGAINQHITELSTDLEAESRRKRFLESFKFPEINQRYNDLMSSKHASFRRVFASYTEISSNDASQTTTSDVKKRSGTEESGTEEIAKVWAEFVEWLQSGSSLFFIRGKPGSGKSTLVKFIIDNRSTKQLLSRWSPDATVMSHFFWKIGSSPQNSVKGLFCSLIYQGLKDDREMMDSVLDQFNLLASNAHYHDWSMEDLKAVLHSILESDRRHRCIFIDGLDEISNQDGLPKLTQSIDEVLKFPNVKICVASRPETQVMTWLKKKNVPGMLLENLTRPEMRAFLDKEFEPFLSDNSISKKTYRRLSEECISKAQGVFLWLHLVIRSLTSGLQNEDPDEMLLARLKELPSELKQLYADMWQRLNENNPVYRETAARYFRYALQDGGLIPMFPEVGFPSGFPEIQQPTLFQIACAESEEAQDDLLKGNGAINAAEVQRLSDKAKLDIQNRCAGLLHVRPSGVGRRMTAIIRNANDLGEVKDKTNVDDALFSRVVFIHRTAHDFLTDTETGQAILESGVLSENDIKVRLLKGLLCLLRFLHSEHGVMGRTGGIFWQLIDISKAQGSSGMQEAVKLLRIMQRLYENKVIGADKPLWQPQAPFLCHLMEHEQFDDFVVSSLAHADSKALVTDVLREAWDPDLSLYYGRDSGPSTKLVETLISMGADAHANGVNSRQQMGRMEPFERMGTAFTNLLMFGVNSIDEGKHLGGKTAGEMLRAAMTLAMTCPDLNATTLVVGSFKSDETITLMNLTWLSRPETFISEHSFWILYEVDCKFLLLRLLSGLGVDLDDDALRGARVDELLPKLQNPSVTARFMFSWDEKAEGLACHRITAALAAPEAIDPLFAPSTSETDKTEDSGERQSLAQGKSTYKRVKRLAEDARVEKLDIESAVLTLAGEKLGFCTLLEAGILPPLEYVERLEEHKDLFPRTLQQLKAEVMAHGKT